MKQVGEKIYFCRRSGTIVGHATFKRNGYAEEVETFYIVELSPESADYLKHEGYDSPDCFISIVLVHPHRDIPGDWNN